MNDKDFLQWIHDRLVKIHDEHPNADYMNKLQNIIDETSDSKFTPNITRMNK